MSSKSLTRFKDIPVEVRASVVYTLCSIVQNALSFITLPIFMRLLSKEQYGQYTIYASWSAMISIFVTLNLPYGSFSKAMVKYEDKRDSYISSAEGICLLLAGIFFVIYLPARTFWNRFLELPTTLVVVMILEILANTGILFWSGKKRFEYRYKEVIAVTLITSLLAPTLAYLLVMNTEEKGDARIIGYASVTILVGGIIFIMNACRGKRLYNKELWSYALQFNLPLIFYYLSQSIFNQSDRVMIGHYCGKDKAAAYGAAYTLSMVLTFVLNAINNSYVPWFYGKIKQNARRDNQKISAIIAILMAFLLLGVIWLAPEIILIMGGAKYMEAIWVVPPVAMSVLLLFYSQLFINVEFYYEKKKHLVLASVGSAVVNIVLNAWLIPIFGFVAAGYTTLASYVIFVAANYIAMVRTLKQKEIENDAYNMKLLLAIFAVFAGFTCVAVLLYKLLLIRYIFIGIVLITAFFMRKKIMEYINLLRAWK